MSDKVNLSSDFFTDLIKDTEFKIASSGSLMHSRVKVSTPLYVINCIYGGGIPLGIMSEISGSPGAGKSTFLYQCMGNYQKEYPDGVPVIYDMEASMDNSRLKILGVDTDKVLRLPATSMEDAFSNMFKMLNKMTTLSEQYEDISSFQIYDSLAAGGTAKQHQATSKGESAFGAGTMMEPQRIIKQNLSNVLPYLEKFPVFIGLINQVFTSINAYGGASVNSGGGFGLKHFCHSHIMFSDPKDDYKNGFLIGVISSVQLKKSKLSPKMINIPCYIDVTQGGRIDEVDSFVRYLTDSNINLISAGSWYKFGDYVKSTMIERYPVLSGHSDLTQILNKNIRKDDMYSLIHEDRDILDLLQISLIEFIDDIYPAQRDVNDEYQKQLISSCKFFRESDNMSELRDMVGDKD